MLYTMEAQFVPGTLPGSKGGRRSLCVKSLCVLFAWLKTLPGPVLVKFAHYNKGHKQGTNTAFPGRRGPRKNKKNKNKTKKSNEKITSKNVRVGFWQNGVFAGFYFWAAAFFQGFCRRIFSPHFLWEKVPRKILQENPQQNPPNLHIKNPRHISAEGLGQKMSQVTSLLRLRCPKLRFQGKIKLRCWAAVTDMQSSGNQEKFYTVKLYSCGGALNPYILNQDISKRHFSAHGAV